MFVFSVSECHCYMQPPCPSCDQAEPGPAAACLTSLPDTKTAGRTTRRRAATAAPKTAAAAPPTDAEPVQPVALFEANTEQASLANHVAGELAACKNEALIQVMLHCALQESSAPAEAAPGPAAAAAETPAPTEQPAQLAGPCPADKPPATPSQPKPAHPAVLLAGATPTGLGLSSLLPLSPLLPAALQANTPAATPLGGVEANNARITSALHAAAQVRSKACCTVQLYPFPCCSSEVGPLPQWLSFDDSHANGMHACRPLVLRPCPRRPLRCRNRPPAMAMREQSLTCASGALARPSRRMTLPMPKVSMLLLSLAAECESSPIFVRNWDLTTPFARLAH
jgi:hypothetical protein